MSGSHNNQAQCLKTITLRLLSFSLSGFMLVTGVAHGQVQHDKSLTPDQKSALTASQAVIGKQSGQYFFVNQDGKVVDFARYRGKPLLVSFIYTSCYHVCPLITSNLKKNIRIAREALGTDNFNIVTIGFDTEIDTPERMRYFATQRNIEFNNWDFLSADTENIKAITRDLGFSFTPSAKGFNHLAQTTVLDESGKVYRQIYGVDYAPPVLVEPLKELVYGKQAQTGMISDWVNGIRLFCTIYDPAIGRYYFDYSIFLMIFIGVLCLGSILIFIIRSWREHGES